MTVSVAPVDGGGEAAGVVGDDDGAGGVAVAPGDACGDPEAEGSVDGDDRSGVASSDGASIDG